MNKRAILIAIPLVLLSFPDAADFASNGLFEEAERLHSEGSYVLALAAYRRLDREDLDADRRRWLDFRLADCLWRSEAATNDPDASQLEQARGELEAMARDETRAADRDRVWIAAQESLGDSWWLPARHRDWGRAWPHYRAALEAWAGSREIDLAREHYLAIVRRTVVPPADRPHPGYGYWSNNLPLDVLESALRIARDPADRAFLQYAIAMTVRDAGQDRAHHHRTLEAFEAAIAAGRGNAWYDDALFHYAQWLERSGKLARLDGGGTTPEPDYRRALESYERLTREFERGETRYFDQALRQIETITRPVVGVAVGNVVLPGSEVEYALSWRNVGRVDLALYPVELTRDVKPGPGDAPAWEVALKPPSAAPVRRWTHETNDTGDHVPAQRQLVLADGQDLAAGAYVLEATAEGKRARDLLLITGSSLVIKTAGGLAMTWLVDALDGSPRAGAEVALWAAVRHRNHWQWTTLRGRTDADGLVEFDLAAALPGAERYWQLMAAARDGRDQAFATAHAYRRDDDEAAWRIYTFTDRPAYRPGDEVGFKLIARLHDGERYSTPSGRKLAYSITDPRGAEAAKGELTLGQFGSAWSSLTLDPTAALGPYNVSFVDPERDRHVGSAVLLRLEEYKLPEFRVAVRPPEDENGQPLTFRPGEPVEVAVEAEYYFGGPVAGASVEALVYQRPLWIRWQPPHEYPWLYADMVPPSYPSWERGQVVHRETLPTDADGRTTLSFTPPAGPGQDFEYTVEARVTDASRREIVGSGSVRVGRQGYYAFLYPEHHLHLPGEQVRVTVKTIDANQRPVPAEARVIVTRDTWTEIWIDPHGRRIEGPALDRLRRETRHEPPVERPGGPGWVREFHGYRHEQVDARILRTGEDGEARFEFFAAREGYYRVRWSGEDDHDVPVEAETSVWVADPQTTHVGYRHGGVGIIVDKDTFRAGSRAPVMLTAPVEGAWILFSVEGGELLEHRVIHLEGRVKLIEIEVGEQHVPNVFLEAAMVADARLHVDVQQVVVPPERHYLDVEVVADRDTYEPRERGRLTVTTRDHRGNPVAAEVALALADESVFYVQEDHAGDPRPFFFGDKRGRLSALSSTFGFKPYRSSEEVEQESRAADERRHDLTVPGRRLAVAEAESKAAAPAPAERQEGLADADSSRLRSLGYVGGARAAEQPAVVVRADFRATALWEPALVTGADGTARVETVFPDTLTSWKATARVATAGSAFGIADTTVRTRKPLIVRLQAPRFFVVGDTATISAVINNNTAQDLTVRTELKADGLTLEKVGDPPATVVPAAGETRIDWTASAREAGQVRLEVSARAGDHADAMASTYEAHEHGIDKLIARSGKIRGDDAVVTLNLPAERRPGSTTVTVQVTPSMAVTLLDSLPYLIDYPYGCTEQTMSRFLPAVIVTRTLERMGLEPRDVAGRIFGGIEPGSAVATHRDGQRALTELRRMTTDGLNRLYDFQHGDGGWGWWKEGESDHFMSAYVVWGLGLAIEAGVDVETDVLGRARAWLDRELVERERQPDLQAFMLHALAASAPSAGARRPSRFERTAFDNVFARRNALNAYTRALLALAAHHHGDEERARLLVRNLVNGVERDRAPDTSVVQQGIRGGDNVMGTAHWGEDGLWWRWSEGGVEATAFALRALLAVDPANELVEPVTNWLVKNRRGAQWSNTRDTAITVLALTEYLERSGELATDLEYELSVNGSPVARQRIRPAEVIGAPSRFEIDPALIRDGDNRVRVRRVAGDGPLYFAAEARFFSLEEPVAAAGNEIFAHRQYFKQVPHATLLKGYEYEQLPLGDGDTVTSGERVEVVLTVETKNDYEYLVFEDLKPAGLEAVEIRSGQPLRARELKSAAYDVPPDRRDPDDYTGRQRPVYQELRDRRVALFLDKLPEGVWELRYELRAEVPGRFHALPALGHAMYVPEIRCNGTEIRLIVEDR